MEQSPQGRAGSLHAAVREVLTGHAGLRLHDGVHARGEQIEILRFRPEQFLGEDGVRSFEQAAEEPVHEIAR